MKKIKIKEKIRSRSKNKITDANMLDAKERIKGLSKEEMIETAEHGNHYEISVLVEEALQRNIPEVAEKLFERENYFRDGIYLLCSLGTAEAVDSIINILKKYESKEYKIDIYSEEEYGYDYRFKLLAEEVVGMKAKSREKLIELAKEFYFLAFSNINPHMFAGIDPNRIRQRLMENAKGIE